MRHARPPAAYDVAVPSHDRGGSDDQPHRGEAVDGQRPGQQRQPRPVRPRQTRMSERPLALGDSELMAQHQDLRVLPPRLPPRQAQHRHRTGHDQENQLQAHRPKIIPSPDGPRRARPAPERGTEPTAICRASAQVAQVFGTHRCGFPTITQDQTARLLSRATRETTRWLSNDMFAGTGQKSVLYRKQIRYLCADNNRYVKSGVIDPGQPQACLHTVRRSRTGVKRAALRPGAGGTPLARRDPG